MHFRAIAIALFAFGAAVGAPVACSPQVVDAVDPVPETGGASTTGGSAGMTGGSAGAGATGGTGVACPDGGSEADRDGDSVPDCLDACPEDAEKTAGQGLCGCGIPDSFEDGSPTCARLVELLAHRYAFNGTGIAVVDTAAEDSPAEGNADGEVVNAELSGQGTLPLDGFASEQYAGLPNRILSTLPGSVTLEAWLTWAGGGPNWQRIFDFGDNDGPREGEQGPSGTSYLFLTPRTPLDPAPGEFPPQNQKLRVGYKRPGAGEWEVMLDADIALPSGVETHVALVIDGTLKQMSLYVDGEPRSAIAHFRNVGAPAYTSMLGAYDWSAPVPTADGGTVMPPAIDLSVINDINNWLGRSQFIGDAELQATYNEFRIYSGALTPELIAISKLGGPNAVFLQ